MTDHMQLADQLATASARLIRWLRAADAEPALSGPQASALAVILHSGCIRMSDLARFEEVSRPAITNTADQLRRLGLIARERDSDDGRVSWLRATEKGRQVFADGQRRRIAPLTQALEGLSESDRTILLNASLIMTGLRPTAAEVPPSRGDG